MSDTPRTDAIHAAINAGDGCHADDIISACEFARQLERELAAAREANARLAERLALAGRDTERLDWIEQHPEIGLGSSRPHVRIVGLSPCDGNGWRTLQYHAETYRAAIDAAKETKQ